MDYKFYWDRLLYCRRLDHLHLRGTFWNSMCSIFMQEIISGKTFHSFEDAILTYTEGISPSRTPIGSTKCDHLNIVREDALCVTDLKCMFSIILRSTKGKHYTLLFTTVCRIASCSVLGRSGYVVVGTAWPILPYVKDRSVGMWSLTHAGAFSEAIVQNQYLVG